MAIINYFSHDCNARNDEKLLAVRMRHGAEGYAVFVMILERLRDSAEYMSVKDYNAIAFDLRVSSELVKSIVENFGLFTFAEDGKRFYSEGFSKRMKLKDDIQKARAEAGKQAMKKRWGSRQKAASEPVTVLTNSEDTYSEEVVKTLEYVVDFFRQKNPSILGGTPTHLYKMSQLFTFLGKSGEPMQMIRTAVEKMKHAAPIKSGKLHITLDTFLKPEMFTKIYNGDFDKDYSVRPNKGREAGVTFDDVRY